MNALRADVGTDRYPDDHRDSPVPPFFPDEGHEQRPGRISKGDAGRVPRHQVRQIPAEYDHCSDEDPRCAPVELFARRFIGLCSPDQINKAGDGDKSYEYPAVYPKHAVDRKGGTRISTMVLRYA